MRQRVALVTNPEEFAGPAAVAGLRELGMTVVGESHDGMRTPQEMIAATISRYGHIDVLINNDVLLPRTPVSDDFDPVIENRFEDFTEDQFRWMLDDLVIRPFSLTQAALPYLRESEQPVILFITSCNAVRPHARVAMYNAARAATTNLAASLAKELGGDGIVVNSVGPTFFSNPTYFPEEKIADNPALEAQLRRDVPIGRLGRADEMAALIGFLASGRAAPITGEFIAFSGGWRI